MRPPKALLLLLLCLAIAMPARCQESTRESIVISGRSRCKRFFRACDDPDYIGSIGLKKTRYVKQLQKLRYCSFNVRVPRSVLDRGTSFGVYVLERKELLLQSSFVVAPDSGRGKFKVSFAGYGEPYEFYDVLPTSPDGRTISSVILDTYFEPCFRD